MNCENSSVQACPKSNFTQNEKSTKATQLFKDKIPFWIKALLLLALVAMILLSFAWGRYAISPQELIQGIHNHFFNSDVLLVNEEVARIDKVIFNVRFPRILLVVLVGAALSVAGASYQGMFKNPLVSPDILGSSAGASFGACIALLFNMPNYMVQFFAFAGGMIAVGMAVWLTRIVKYDAILGLVLGGILVSTLFQSGTSLIKYVADAQDKLPEITFWLMGSFSSVNKTDLFTVIIPMICGFAILLLQSWKLNVLSFGDEEARAMGISTRNVRLSVIFASTLLTSLSVAVSGIIGYVGLVIPHLARAIVGPNYKVLLPTSMFVGATFLLIIDNISRLVTDIGIPIGILTSILGVPFFIIIFRRQMKGWK